MYSNKIFSIIFFTLLSLALCDPFEIRTCFGVRGPVEINPIPLGTTWRGWGTSLSWWANWSGGLKRRDRSLLMDLIFDQRGLNFNIVRYNIGGGGRTENPKLFSSGKFKYRLIPGFKASQNSPYNWSSDVKQRKVLLEAKRRGANIFEAFSNSPPSWMTVSGDFTGAKKPYSENLDRKKFSDFADYLTEVVRVYKKRYGVEFQTLEPFNEPTGSAWVQGNVQEGCHFNLPSIDKLIQVVAKRLSQKGLKTRIAAPDSLLKDASRVLKSLSAESWVAIENVNIHSYERKKALFNLERQVGVRKAVAAMVAERNKTLIVSESGPFGLKGSEYEVALAMARNVMLGINVLKASGWVYWQAVEDFETEPFWGLIFAKWTESHTKKLRYRIRPQYYVTKQFSKWITQGSVVLRVGETCRFGMVAVYRPIERELVIVVANYLSDDVKFPVRVKFKGVERGGLSIVSRHRTTEEMNYRYIGSFKVYLPFEGNLELPKKSITTYRFSNVVM